MAEDAATAEDEEGEIHEDQKLDPSREGESRAGMDELLAVAVDVDAVDSVDLEEVADDVDAFGGSASPAEVLLLEAAPGACEEEVVAEFMLSRAPSNAVLKGGLLCPVLS